MDKEQTIRAHYTTISVVRNLINHGETIIAFAKEQIALLENHAGVVVQNPTETPPDAHVEQLKALAQMLGVKGDTQQWGIDRESPPGPHGEG